MANSTKVYKLNNGTYMPACGLGTWQGQIGAKDEAAMEESIIFALRNGYRLIDTAQLYGVEHIVGRAIRKSEVPRNEITVATKFWGNHHHDVESALDISLSQLGADYVDVFLMHWPWATTSDGRVLCPSESPTFVETWKLMEQLPKEKCRGIGVCNFTEKTLEILLEHAKVPPAINQIELHALNPSIKLLSYCQSKGIHVMAWGTLGSDSLNAKKHILDGKLMKDIAKSL
ncbi:Glycerol 2-dehydrogenase [Colletotrichum siamense]|nr:Glycerol 2-dehydrogenase [Colletotrichum siamense]